MKKGHERKSAAPKPVAFGSDNFNNEKSPTSVERPKKLTFTELAEELTRRSGLSREE